MTTASKHVKSIASELADVLKRRLLTWYRGSIDRSRPKEGPMTQNIRDILIAAREDVEAADIPPDLKEVAFREALRMHAGGGTDSGNGATESSTGGATADGGTGASSGATDGSPLSRIAQALSLDQEIVGEVFNVVGGDIELIAAPGALAPRTATATKEIALLVAAGRQGAGLEEWTPVSEVREWCENYRKLDSPNFSSTIKEMEDVLRFRGTPRKREIRMAKPAWEQAAALVRRLGGAE
jgi:hypothetical protein